jgi:hypothetical protein
LGVRLRQTDLNWRDVQGEIVALDLRAARYFGINRSGRLLWDALATGASHEDLVRLLSSEFGLDRDRAASDVERFVAELRSRGLIVAEDEADGSAA